MMRQTYLLKATNLSSIGSYRKSISSAVSNRFWRQGAAMIWVITVARICLKITNCSNHLFEVARAGWTNERPFNGHNFHRMPASSSSKLDQQLPTAFSHRHDLCYSPFHLCTRMIGLFPQRGRDLF